MIELSKKYICKQNTNIYLPAPACSCCFFCRLLRDLVVTGMIEIEIENVTVNQKNELFNA